MKFSQELDELFNTHDLYNIFHVDKGADARSINKSYKKLSLTYHPDKCFDKSLIKENTRIFQALSKAHKILSDPQQRKFFDDTGCIDEDFCEGFFASSSDPMETWQAYWRAIFPKITHEDILHFENVYKNSKEETKDLIDSYNKYRGNMDLIMDSIMCATYEDEERFRDILLEQIEQGNVRSFNRFVNEPAVRRKNRRRKLLREEKESKKLLQSKGERAGLASLIKRKQEARKKDFDCFLDRLISNYGDGSSESDQATASSSNSISFSSSRVGKKISKRGSLKRKRR